MKSQSFIIFAKDIRRRDDRNIQHGGDSREFETGI